MKNFKKFISENIEYEIKNKIEDASSKEEIESVLNDNDIDYEEIVIDDEPLLIFDRYVIDDFSFPTVQEKEEFIERNYDKMAVDVEDRINDNFWNYPSGLYHATKKENLDAILKYGLKASNKTRGIFNRRILNAIFMVTDPELLFDESYGSVIIEIDAVKMKKDGFTPFITKEPQVVEKLQKEYMARKLKYHDYEDTIDSSDPGIWEDTFIVREDIPAMYLSV